MRSSCCVVFFSEYNYYYISNTSLSNHKTACNINIRLILARLLKQQYCYGRTFVVWTSFTCVWHLNYLYTLKLEQCISVHAQRVWPVISGGMTIVA